MWPVTEISVVRITEGILLSGMWLLFTSPKLCLRSWYNTDKGSLLAHTFTVALNDEIPAVLTRVGSAITESGGVFSGDAAKGVFQGNSVMGPIKGEYCSVSENEIRITINDKPFIVPYSMIEGEIKKYFS